MEPSDRFQDIDSLLSLLGVRRLRENLYEPRRLGLRDAGRTAYRRGNAGEFDDLAERYGAALDRGEFAPLEARLIGGGLGWGLFAAEPLAAGGLIGEYLGVVRPARRARALPGGGFTTDYAWGFPGLGWPFLRLEIDAREAGGPLRFANHAFDASAGAEHLEFRGRWRVFFVAGRDIAAGEEITVDYGMEYWAGGRRELVLPDGTA